MNLTLLQSGTPRKRQQDSDKRSAFDFVTKHQRGPQRLGDLATDESGTDEIDEENEIEFSEEVLETEFEEPEVGLTLDIIPEMESTSEVVPEVERAVEDTPQEPEEESSLDPDPNPDLDPTKESSAEEKILETELAKPDAERTSEEIPEVERTLEDITEVEPTSPSEDVPAVDRASGEELSSERGPDLDTAKQNSVEEVPETKLAEPEVDHTSDSLGEEGSLEPDLDQLKENKFEEKVLETSLGEPEVELTLKDIDKGSCNLCLAPIKENGVEANGEMSFHKNCFECLICHTELNLQTRFHISGLGPFCLKHARKTTRFKQPTPYSVPQEVSRSHNANEDTGNLGVAGARVPQTEEGAVDEEHQYEGKIGTRTLRAKTLPAYVNTPPRMTSPQSNQSPTSTAQSQSQQSRPTNRPHRASSMSQIEEAKINETYRLKKELRAIKMNFAKELKTRFDSPVAKKLERRAFRRIMKTRTTGMSPVTGSRNSSHIGDHDNERTKEQLEKILKRLEEDPVLGKRLENDQISHDEFLEIVFDETGPTVGGNTSGNSITFAEKTRTSTASTATTKAKPITGIKPARQNSCWFNFNWLCSDDGNDLDSDEEKDIREENRLLKEKVAKLEIELKENEKLNGKDQGL